MDDSKPYRQRKNTPFAWDGVQSLNVDERVAGWYRKLKNQLERFEPYMQPGRLVTFQTVSPEERAFYESLLDTLKVPEQVCAIFIPPSVVQQAMWPLSGGWGKSQPPAEYYAVSPDAGAVMAQSCGDSTTIVNALFAFPPYAPGVDVYQDGQLLAGYMSEDIDACVAELNGHLATFLT